MEHNLLNSWLFIGVALLIIEMLSLTIVLLFGGLAALTVGAFIYCDWIVSDHLRSHLLVFFISYFIWAVLLWSPLQKLRKGKGAKKYNDMIGSEAVVNEDVTHSKAFSVQWSGTTMNAILYENDLNTELKKGDIVKIVAIKGNRLTVSTNLTS